MPPDSFFGASGGESVDTKNRGNSTGSSLSYSPSQLDAGDVDPVAEADVYLAYGRDLQAEEILREALRTNPQRIGHPPEAARDPRQAPRPACLRSARDGVHKLTGGNGADWNRVVELGHDLDPGNPLYRTGGRGVSAAEAAAFAGTLAAATATPARLLPRRHRAPWPKPVVAAAPPPAFVPSVAPLDFDLDLSKPPAPAASTAAAAPVNASLPAARNGR